MKRHILLIDDEEAIRIIVQSAIEATTDWNVTVTDGGHQGLHLAERQQPDAIISDVMMPDMDGVALFQQLQKRSQTQHIPVIFLTAKAIQSEQRELRAVGTAGLITKPFDVESIAQQIKGLLHWVD